MITVGENEGYEDLAKVLQGRMSAITSDADSSKALDFGTIGSDGSLRTNSYPVSIPKSDYLVCGNLLGHYISDQAGLPQRFRAGIRVLVIWVGNDAVVVDVIHPASEVI